MRWRKLDPRRWKRSLAQEAIPVDHSSIALNGEALLAPHLALGRRGEFLAAEYLKRAGYRLVASNLTLPVGRSLRGALVHAEIDLVAYEDTTLCFVEVKTRASDWYAAPEANVDLRKQRQITRAARVYRHMFGLTDALYRYDVVSVILPPAETNSEIPAPRLQLLRNFWTDERFRKRRWGNPSPNF